MARQLVALKRVVELLPIDGADNIQLAHVENTAWNLVVRKGEFKVGDMGLLFEIDSAIEDCEQLRFLGKARVRDCPAKGKQVRVFTIQTKLLKGVVSQGLLVKPAMFGIPDDAQYTEEQLRAITHTHHIADLVSPSTDVGITALPLPWWVPKTDQVRIDADISIFDKYKDREFAVETKADGASMSVFYVAKELCPEQFGVTSHNRWLRRKQRPWKTQFAIDCIRSKWYALVQLFRRLIPKLLATSEPEYEPTTDMFVLQAEELNLRRILERVYRSTGRSLVYQGELIGPGIQGNRDSRSGRHWLLFDIYDVNEQRYLLPQEKYDFYYMYLYPYVEHVQHIQRNMKVLQEFPTAEAMQTLASHYTTKNHPAEGVVVKSETAPYVTFKCISQKYLLKGRGDADRS